ncbi:Lcl C-terminal domain-containing protein [Terriglobus albidus]|uniref:Lcl C-terminal domain-containing protein n=1 Tax=Terriglobus albidus TaxID=1592106 RepID=UPI0021DFDA76|nr:DUF1566 domain-containing protein [Terriglobus albidus]
MKRTVLILFFVITVVAKAHSSMQGKNSAEETLARGYWIDPATGLTWTAKDNGNDITWGNAVKYCQDLRLAGYSDWRLPTIEELEKIYDGSGFTAPHSKGSTLALAGKAKGGLLLTGAREWSNSRVLDDRGHRTGIAWQYDFAHGERWRLDPIGYRGSLRALCVRHP